MRDIAGLLPFEGRLSPLVDERGDCRQREPNDDLICTFCADEGGEGHGNPQACALYASGELTEKASSQPVATAFEDASRSGFSR